MSVNLSLVHDAIWTFFLPGVPLETLHRKSSPFTAFLKGGYIFLSGGEGEDYSYYARQPLFNYNYSTLD